MKICRKCHDPKPDDAFNKGKNGKTHSYCRECQKIYDRTLYKDSAARRTAMRLRRGQQRLACRAYITNHLLTHPCVDCGEDDPIVLEFDHVRGVKKANVADMAKRASSISALQLEIEKCEVRCANCHRRVTHQRRSRDAV